MKSSDVQLMLMSLHLEALRFRPIFERAGMIAFMSRITERELPPIVASSRYQMFRGEEMDLDTSSTSRKTQTLFMSARNLVLFVTF